MQCFVCMKDVGVALFGAMKNDVEAPRRVCLDTTPCEECKGYMDQGIILISFDESKSDDMNNPWRTGGWCVVKEDFIKRHRLSSELEKKILEQRMLFLPDDYWNMIGLPR